MLKFQNNTINMINNYKPPLYKYIYTDIDIEVYI